jgi:hypothetical protein
VSVVSGVMTKGVRGFTVLRGEHSYNLPPIFTTFDPRWKIRTTPRPTGKDVLDVPEGEVAQPAGLQSSSSGSTC